MTRIPDLLPSERCSCNTMRDEDEGCETLHDNPHNACIQKSFNARCTESNKATNASDGVDYAVGTMVWTLVSRRASYPCNARVGYTRVAAWPTPAPWFPHFPLSLSLFATPPSPMPVVLAPRRILTWPPPPVRLLW
jgi:hypothetical protein